MTVGRGIITDSVVLPAPQPVDHRRLLLLVHLFVLLVLLGHLLAHLARRHASTLARAHGVGRLAGRALARLEGRALLLLLGALRLGLGAGLVEVGLAEDLVSGEVVGAEAVAEVVDGVAAGGGGVDGALVAVGAARVLGRYQRKETTFYRLFSKDVFSLLVPSVIRGGRTIIFIDSE